jgi:hypothetical protein
VQKGENKGRKEFGRIEKGREFSEVGNDLNNKIQLWDDDPLWVVKNPKYLLTRCFHPLGYGVILRIYKLEIKICTMRMKKIARRRNLSYVSH